MKPITKSECVKVVYHSYVESGAAHSLTKKLKIKGKSIPLTSVVEMNTTKGEIFLTKIGGTEPPKQFTFDGVYDQKSVQVNIFNEAALPIIDNVLIGYNGTIFAYGQTGTGKTYTIEGVNKEDEKGIMPRAFETVFSSIESDDHQNRQYLVRASYLEIYKEEVRDLLSKNPKNKLELKENKDTGVYVKNLCSFVVKSVKELNDVMFTGRTNRSTAETAMNERSSRSHSIFTITIEMAEIGEDAKSHIRMGKLNIVDLAGSERQSKTQAIGERLEEATKINLSLSTLCHVIATLVDSKLGTHIPYRNSKLTRLLQDSLGGNTKTVMIANIGPAEYNYEETLNTLRYANRAKHITNNPRINEDPKDALLRQYENEIKKLKEMLDNLGKNGNFQQIKEKENEFERSMIDSGVLSMNQHIDKTEQLEKDKNELANQLMEREQIILSEKEQKEKLQKMIQEMENKVMVGGKKLEEKEKELAKQYKQMQEKLHKQKKKEMQLIEDALKKEEEMLLIEKNYKDIQEELKDDRKIIGDLRGKYKAAMSEIKDLQTEHQGQKEELLDNLRNSETELEFYKKSLELILPEAQIELLRSKSQWDDENKTWTIPVYKIQDTQVYLPNIPKLQGKRL